ncbi:M1 family metallopeptidase [Xylocopilactobacillus apicola]|uniref:Aminopeptidase n=1 Tax=Xylocopilactobacillus apicola TaxID=2932184 RepID=A0AAU9CV12_9LACO|nr:M1 family aminopeptidase [Xylocopilactobacillus apicola]BDR57839.1 aminopeptidase N [Xylocopilactobacillus apicola]
MTETTRFYDDFQPQHYDIFLDINRSTKKITGTTTITGMAKTPKIKLHQKNLDIDSIEANHQAVNFKVNDAIEAVELELAAGQQTIAIKYSAPLTDTMMGIYPSYYQVDGVKKQLIGTQFETTAARQAFPGVDEPEAKATFSLAIKFDEQPGETIIANMPENRVENGIHYFDETKQMSTYLVAFAFGDLQKAETTTKSGVKIGVYSTKAHQPKELDFALDIAKSSIEFFEDFYETPYPLPHSWQLALPDFSAGAMENWGLVTYREAYLLIDPDNTSLRTKLQVATVIAHELAHQWFGDLVTMKWWDDLWLNESFANMMEYVAVDALKPDWQTWELFQTAEVPASLQRDAIDGVQAVHVQVEDPAEIDSIFDGAIVYAKGARMLVMVRSLIGDEALRAGLKKYFSAHKFNNATGKDLWAALADASGLDVGEIMNSWLEQPGYPVVKANVVNGDLILTQQQFFIGEGKDAGRLWQIPLNSNYSVVPKIMSEKEINLGNYNKLRTEFGVPFRLNIGNNSHFIVKYDQQLLDDILKDVKQLDSISKLQILQDLRLLAEGQQISYAEIVPLLPQFSSSKSNIVSTALYRVMTQLKQFVKPETSEETSFKALMDQMSAEQVKRLGWQAKVNESIDDQLMRPSVLNASLYAKNPQTISKAHKLYLEHQNQLTELPASVRSFVLINEMENYGSPELFQRFFKAYQETSDAGFKSDLEAAITMTDNPDLIKEIITKFKDPDIIKPQDLRGWYRNVLANPKGEQAAWDWLRTNWQWLSDTVGGDMEFTTYITVTAMVLKTRQRFEEFSEFFNPKLNTPGLTREINMDTRLIEARVKLIEAEEKAVNKAINQIIN